MPVTCRHRCAPMCRSDRLTVRSKKGRVGKSSEDFPQRMYSGLLLSCLHIINHPGLSSQYLLLSQPLRTNPTLDSGWVLRNYFGLEHRTSNIEHLRYSCDWPDDDRREQNVFEFLYIRRIFQGRFRFRLSNNSLLGKRRPRPHPQVSPEIAWYQAKPQL